MGLDDASNTCLVLGLGFPTNPETPHKTSKKPPATAAPATGFEPFLTLGLSDESYKVTVTKKVDVNKGGGCLQHRHHEEPPTSAAAAGDWCCPASPDPSAVSSFSSGRVRRERDFSSEEDEDGVNARKKLRLNKEQSALLEESFKQHSALKSQPKSKASFSKAIELETQTS